MNVLQICYRIPYPLHDGGAIAMYQMAKGIVDNGGELTMMCYNTHKHYVSPRLIPSELTKLGRVIPVGMDARVKPRQALLNWLFSDKAYHIRRFESETFGEQLKVILVEKSFDMIIFEGLYTTMHIDIAREFSPNSKLVFRPHNIEYLIWDRLSHQSRWVKMSYLKTLSKRLERYESAVAGKFDLVAAITPVDEIYFKNKGAKQTISIPTGIDAASYKTTDIEPLENSVFHIGSMNWIPNQEAVEWFIQKVWPLILKEVPNATFYVAGKSMPRSFNRYDHKNNIVVVGEVKEAHSFIHSHAVMVVPILSGSGLRIKIVEGLALGKAIVSTTIGAEGIPTRHEQNICIADSPEEFAKSVIVLLKNPSLRKEIERQARDLALKEFDNTALVGKLFNELKHRR